jgi:hypothetical protein
VTRHGIDRQEAMESLKCGVTGTWCIAPAVRIDFGKFLPSHNPEGEDKRSHRSYVLQGERATLRMHVVQQPPLEGPLREEKVLEKEASRRWARHKSR